MELIQILAVMGVMMIILHRMYGFQFNQTFVVASAFMGMALFIVALTQR